jgi:hypothetical protein
MRVLRAAALLLTLEPITPTHHSPATLSSCHATHLTGADFDCPLDIYQVLPAINISLSLPRKEEEECEVRLRTGLGARSVMLSGH